MYYGILVDDPFLLLVVVERGGGGVGAAGMGSGAVNLINLNILDKSVKTLWHKGANDITERFLKSSKFRPDVDGPC